jgi:hypothetical protein
LDGLKVSTPGITSWEVVVDIARCLVLLWRVAEGVDILQLGDRHLSSQPKWILRRHGVAGRVGVGKEVKDVLELEKLEEVAQTLNCALEE